MTLHKSAQGRPDFGEPFTGLVAGVIGDVHHFGASTPAWPEVYIPYTRNPWGHMSVIARTGVDPTSLVPSLRHALLVVDPDITFPSDDRSVGRTGFVLLEDLRTGGLSAERLNTSLLSGFGLGAPCCSRRSGSTD